MHQNITLCTILIVLLAACAPAVTSVPVMLPNPTARLTTTPTPETSLAMAIPQLTATVTPSCEPVKTSLKIMPLGDSITYGEGIAGYGGYRNLLGALLESDGYIIDFVGSQKSGEESLADPDNEGHPGWKIADIQEAIDTEGWLEAYQPDIILLHIGTNDVQYGNSVYSARKLSALLDNILMHLPETHVIVARLIRTRWGSDTNHVHFNNKIPEIIAAKGSQVSMVDMQDILSKSDFTNLYHPSPKGYDKMAHAWETAILALELKDECVTFGQK